MKTLYVSDLDGTLLRSDQTVSPFTAETVNRLTEEGMLFSYATARSLVTARKVTKGLNAHIPVILYNGAFIVDNVTEEILLSNYFGEEALEVLDTLKEAHVSPIVYAYIDGVEHFSYIPEKCSKGAMDFVGSRGEDPRTRIVRDEEELKAGGIFIITCIDDEEKLRPLHEKYKDDFHTVFQRDLYSGDQWLEIMPKTTTKAAAILRLKEWLGCDRIVSFGDALNDLDMFDISDEAYAVENAAEELKKRATGIIGRNDEDAVANWLLKEREK